MRSGEIVSAKLKLRRLLGLDDASRELLGLELRDACGSELSKLSRVFGC